MTRDLLTELQSGLGTRFTIERELAGGGFARVFLAHESALKRPVVIKVLSPELVAGISAKRFEREIQLAASLQQANIVPLLAAGQAGDVPYYTMPFVEGLSLRERLRRDSQVPLEQTIGILRDVARALAYAHDRGVVHRDIKPENILLSGDAAVVTDFGIAKAISVAKAADTGDLPNVSLMTQPGTAVGTPAYMAPEQMSGDPSTDHRADLYSFGCLAYEMLAGRPPFGGSLQSLFAAHLSEAPVPVSQRFPECPPQLARLVMQCLEKNPASRPQAARDILRVLDGVVSPATGFARFRQGLSGRQRIAAGAVLLLAVASAVLVISRGRWAGNQHRADAHTVAVIPFFNVSGDSADDYLAEGIADEVATALGNVPGLRVVSRGASYRFRGQRAIDVRQVGAALAADHLLYGSVRRVPNGVRVSAQLARTADNIEAWSRSYDGGTGDALAFQDSIPRAIASALRRQFAGDTTLPLVASTRNRATTNSEAYDLYLRGRFLLQRRGVGVRQAVEKFEQAVAKDTGFARAHGALALALELLPYFDLVSAASIRDRAVTAAERALRRDSTLVEAHTALAMAHQHAYQWRQADERYRRALAIDSSEADAYIQYGRFLFYTGSFVRAQAEFERARRVDPYSAVASGWVGHMLVLSGRSREGLAEIRRALEIDSTNPPLLTFAAEALIALGRREEATAHLERLWRAVPRWRGVAAARLAYLGDQERARAMLRGEGMDGRDPVANMRTATIHLSLGDTARALEALERATDAAEIWPTYYSLSEPFFDPLRRSARFAALIRRVGLDERVFTSPTGGRPR